jgi:hypothetical protein
VSEIDPNRPLTLKEAAEPLFGVSYGTLRNTLHRLLAQGCPFVKRGKKWMIYPKHLEAWDVSRLNADARRHLRHGGLDVQTQEKRQAAR